MSYPGLSIKTIKFQKKFTHSYCIYCRNICPPPGSPCLKNTSGGIGLKHITPIKQIYRHIQLLAPKRCFSIIDILIYILFYFVLSGPLGWVAFSQIWPFLLPFYLRLHIPPPPVWSWRLRTMERKMEESLRLLPLQGNKNVIYNCTFNSVFPSVGGIITALLCLLQFNMRLEKLVLFYPTR